MRETYDLLDFEIFGCYAPLPNGDREFVYRYEIYGEGCPPYDNGVIDSNDYFETEQEARFAAIGHISLLLNGEG